MLVLVTYDVSLLTGSGQKRLRKVAKICLNYGVRVQNSVFECIVDQAQFLLLRDQLLKVMDTENDSIRFYRLGNHYDEKVEQYGSSPSVKVDQPLII